jgi:hypothetical protein
MVQAWMRGVLLIGAAYNMAWAFFLYLAPFSYLKWITEGVQSKNNWVSYQAIGIAIIGIFMFLGTLYPIKFRWLILLSFLAKLIGGLIVFQVIMKSEFTRKFLFHLLMNDIVWLIPLFLITTAAFKSQNNR